MDSNIILHSTSINELKNIIGEVLEEKLKTFTSQPPQQTPQRETFGTRKEVAKELHISLPTLNELTKDGTIPGNRISGRVLYKWEDVYKAVKEIKTLKYRKS